jgi:hypothetical protein
MIAKTLAMFTLLSVTLFIGNAYAEQSFASITEGNLEGNIGSLSGSGYVSIVISNPDGTTQNISVSHTDSGYFQTPISFTQSGNFVIAVSYGEVVIEQLLHVESVETKAPLYKTSEDGVVSVEVFTIPFDVTITENGSVTVHNNDVVKHYVSHTGTTGTVIGGTFYKVIPSMSERTIEFPITGDTIYPIGVYSFEDTVTGEAGTITIEKWGGSDQAIEETTITGVTQGIVEEVGVQENVVVVVNHEDDTQTVVTTDTPVVNTPVVEAPENPITVNDVEDYTMISLHNELIYANNELTKSLESVGLLQTELNNSVAVIAVQQQKIVSLETTVQETSNLSKVEVKGLENKVALLKTQVSTLESEKATLETDKVTLTKERDEWKLLSDQWYAVAMEQVRVMVEVLGL